MDITSLHNVGEKTSKLLNKLNIFTENDLINYYPYRYNVYNFSKDLNEKDTLIIEGTIESIPMVSYIKKNFNRLSFRANIQNDLINVVIFNRAFLKSHLVVGTGVTVIGKFDKKKNVITASDIKLETLSAKIKIEPIYHLTNGLTNKNMSTYINMALLGNYKEITDFIPTEYQEKYNFVNKRTALNIVHNPPSIEKLEEAKNCFLLCLKLIT